MQCVHNWQPLTLLTLCVLILYTSGVQFKINFERQMFEKVFHVIFYLLPEYLPEIYIEEVIDKIYFFFFFFLLEISDLGFEPRGLMSYKLQRLHFTLHFILQQHVFCFISGFVFVSVVGLSNMLGNICCNMLSNILNIFFYFSTIFAF